MEPLNSRGSKHEGGRVEVCPDRDGSLPVGRIWTVGSWQVRTVTALRCSVRTSVLHAEHGGAVDTLRPHRDVSCCHGDHAKSLSRGQSSSRGIRARAHSRIGSPNSWLCKPLGIGTPSRLASSPQRGSTGINVHPNREHGAAHPRRPPEVVGELAAHRGGAAQATARRCRWRPPRRNCW